MKKSVFLTVGIMLILCSSCYAASLGISPGRIDLSGMYKDGYAEAEFLVSSASQNYVTVNARTEGEIKDWIRLPDDKTFSVKMGEPRKIKIIVITPSDAKSGNYSGSVEFLAEEKNETGTIGTVVKTGVIVPVNIEVTGKEIIKCIAGGLSLEKLEEGQPLRFSLLLQNRGNVRVMPKIETDIWTSDMKDLIESGTVTVDEILPTKENEVRDEIFLKLIKSGQYKLSFSIDECNYLEILNLDVLEKGSLKEKGELLGIMGKDSSKPGEIIPIKAEFKNTGETRVIAKFLGEIFLEGKSVDNMSSDNVYIEPGETVTLLSYYSAKKPGKYTVIGKIEYNNKLSEEVSYDFVVQDNSSGNRFSLVFLLYLGILAGIGFIAARIYLSNKKK